MGMYFLKGRYFWKLCGGWPWGGNCKKDQIENQCNNPGESWWRSEARKSSILERKGGKVSREVSEQEQAGLANGLDRYLWNFWLGRLSE